MTAGRVTFVILLAIEAALVYAARRRGTRTATMARTAIFAVPLGFILSLRVYQALATPGVLDWDESYYLSNAVTAAAGHGLYPYLIGYGPMPVLGGVGYAAYVNALAVILGGPTLTALRVVSLLASVAALFGMWRLVKIWYGSAAAWAATTLTAASSLFLLSNTARSDSWTFACVTWALVVFARALERWTEWRPHLLSGLVFGLGMQVHPDVIVTALACGLVYVATWASSGLASRRWELPRPPLLFLAGFSVGFAVYLIANIWIDPAAFYRTTLVVRVDATGWYSSGTGSIAGSFLDPAILLSKERARYAALSRVVSPVELALVTLAIAATYLRRLPADRVLMILIPGVVVATAIMLNNATAVYFIHVAPALLVPLGPLFTRGISRRSEVSGADAGTAQLALIALAAVTFCAIYDGRLIRTVRSSPLDAAQRRTVNDVRAIVERRCKVVGDGGLYVEHFADYPYFISNRDTEVHYAMLFYGVSNESAYWSIKQPDVVFGRLSPALAGYVSANGFSERAPSVWVRREGCAGGP